MRPTPAEAGRTRPGLTARDVTALSLAIALVFVLQIAMAPLPNLEPVTLLFVLYTLHFGRKTLLIVYSFALLEGVYYGFHLWWVMYLYVWTILYLIVRLLSRKRRHGALFWAVTAGLYGLAFGFLCCFPYVALGGIEMALSWWIAGIPFDIPHGIGNFVIMLVLFHPLDRVMTLLRLGEPGSRPVPPATPQQYQPAARRSDRERRAAVVFSDFNQSCLGTTLPGALKICRAGTTPRTLERG